MIIPILQIKKQNTERLKLRVRPNFYDKYQKGTKQVSNASCCEGILKQGDRKQRGSRNSLAQTPGSGLLSLGG